jgi:hypothetical protein
MEVTPGMDVPSRANASAARAGRIARLRERARTETDAIAAVLGAEAWSLGIQMILAVPDEPSRG